MTNKELFIKQYNKAEKFRTNNNDRSKQTIKGCENKLATFLHVTYLFDFLEEISNNDEFDFIYKFTYDYFFKNNVLLEEVDDELVYIEHKTERESTSNLLRREILPEANDTCFFECTNETFLNKKEEIYLEVHHCIPLSYAKKLGKKGDFKENLIAVCPTCHKRIHFEHEDSIVKQDMYKKMYDKIEKHANIYNFETFEEFLKSFS